MKQLAGEPPWPFRRRLGLIDQILPWHRPQVRVATVIGSDDRPLRLWANWSALMPSLGLLMKGLPSKATIRPWIYPNKGGGRAIPFGTMHFNEANNRRWIEALERPDVYLDQLEIWSPARASTIERGICPNLYIQYFGDDLSGEQGFILAVRLDRIAALGEVADAILKEVGTLLEPSRMLIADRSWEERRIAGLIRVNNLDDRGPRDAFEWAESNARRQVKAFA
jgi:hypothetical protein